MHDFFYCCPCSWRYQSMASNTVATYMYVLTLLYSYMWQYEIVQWHIYSKIIIFKPYTSFLKTDVSQFLKCLVNVVHVSEDLCMHVQHMFELWVRKTSDFLCNSFPQVCTFKWFLFSWKLFNMATYVWENQVSACWRPAHTWFKN